MTCPDPNPPDLSDGQDDLSHTSNGISTQLNHTSWQPITLGGSPEPNESQSSVLVPVLNQESSPLIGQPGDQVVSPFNPVTLQPRIQSDETYQSDQVHQPDQIHQTDQVHQIQPDQVQLETVSSAHYPPITIDLQQPWEPTALLIGPGGVKGFCELGALYTFELNGLLHKVTTYVGVSVGSVISLLRVAGYDYAQITDIGRRFDLFQGFGQFTAQALFSKVLQQRGLISHDGFRSLLQDLLTQKFGMVPNFEQLHMFTNLTLILTSFDYTERKTKYYSHLTSPGLSVVEATLASACIPYLFSRLLINQHIVLDGAFSDPYPIQVLDDGQDVLGISVESHVDNNSDSNQLKNEFSLLQSVVSEPMRQLRLYKMERSSQRCRHLELACPPVGTNNLVLPDSEKVHLFQVGLIQGKQFLLDLARTQGLDLGQLVGSHPIESFILPSMNEGTGVDLRIDRTEMLYNRLHPTINSSTDYLVDTETSPPSEESEDTPQPLIQGLDNWNQILQIVGDLLQEN